MQGSNLLSLTWPIRPRTSDQQDRADSWPELSQTNQSKHPSRRSNQESHYRSDASPGSSESRDLDEFEYPQLGVGVYASRHSNSMDKTRNESNEDTSIPSKMIIEMRKSKPGKRCRRTDKICINLQEALESTRCLKKINTKEPMKFRVNFYKSNQCTSSTKGTSKDKNPNVKRMKICIVKVKRPSKLKKIILLDRDMKAQANVRKREAFEAEKMDAIAGDVNSINFNALKITADPEIDVDYVKRMSTLTVYEKNYRNPKEENIPDNIVCDRPDVVDKLSGLRIQQRTVRPKYPPSNNKDIFQMCESIIEDDILRRATFLGLNDDSGQETKDRSIFDSKPLIEHSRNFREYCTNIVRPSLNESLDEFLSEIARLQRKYYEKDQNKARYKRRYYSGLKEVRKHVDLRKVKFAIVAPDIERVQLHGGLDDQVQILLDACREKNVVSCFGLRRRKLGFYAHGKGFVAVIGIANYNGTEELFKRVLVELVNGRNAYRKISGGNIIDLAELNLDSYLLSEQIHLLMKILSPVNS